MKEKPRLKVFLGMMISFIGVLIIIFSPLIFDGQEVLFGQVEGNLFILLATLGTVFSTIIGKDLFKKVNPLFVTSFTFLISSFLFLFFVPSELLRWSFFELNINGWVGIIYGIFFSSAAAYFLYYLGISKIDGQEVGLFTYIDPVAAVLVAFPLLGEYPNLFYIIGTIFVFGGIYVAERSIHWYPFHKLKIKN